MDLFHFNFPQQKSASHKRNHPSSIICAQLKQEQKRNIQIAVSTIHSRRATTKMHKIIIKAHHHHHHWVMPLLLHFRDQDTPNLYCQSSLSLSLFLAINTTCCRCGDTSNLLEIYLRVRFACHQRERERIILQREIYAE